MSVGSILGSLSPIAMGMDIAENAQKTNFLGRMTDGSADLREGLFCLDPKKFMEGLNDMGSAVADQVTNPEFLALAAFCTMGPGAAAAVGLLAGWAKDDDKKAATPQKSRFKDQVDPKALGDMRNIGANGGQGSSTTQAQKGTPAPTSSSSGTQLSVETNVSMNGGSVSTEVGVNVQSGAYATGGATNTGGSTPMVSQEFDLAQSIEWMIERGAFSPEDLDRAARIGTPDGKKAAGWFGTATKGLNPKEARELSIILEKKLKNDPALRAAFESRFGKIDFEKEPLDNGFIYIQTPGSQPSTPAPSGPTLRDPPVALPPKTDAVQIPPPRAGSTDTGGSQKVDVNVEVSIDLQSHTASQPDRNRFEGLSPDQIVRMLMNELLANMDEAVVAKANAYKDAQEQDLQIKQAKSEGKKVDPNAEAKAQSNVTKLQQELQDIMAKRKETFDLLSHFASNQHEMARTALGNIGRI